MTPGPGIESQPNIIQSLVDERYIRRFSGVDSETFFGNVRDQGHGLFIVGLDRHVGFLLYNSEGMHFIHSTAGETRCVIKEEARESSALRRSRYRVLGAISHSEEFIVRWLSQDPFIVVHGGQEE
jgi:hypothetical protein